jgi:hypothetical protein
VINAILEGSVPTHLEKYKFNVSSREPEVANDEGETLVDNETFHKGKWSHGISSDQAFLDANKSDLKTKIMESLQVTQEIDAGNGAPSTYKYDTYVDESLLPNFNEQIEYNDEFDDT